jgi:hypothetical protein
MGANARRASGQALLGSLRAWLVHWRCDSSALEARGQHQLDGGVACAAQGAARRVVGGCAARLLSQIWGGQWGWLCFWGEARATRLHHRDGDREE